MTEQNIGMVDWSCSSCGCVQCMTETFNRQLRISHNTFYCLNGHANFYAKKTYTEEIEGKLMNEYAKNAQLEAEIARLNKSLINRIFKQ